jgi:hypothetical protein
MTDKPAVRRAEPIHIEHTGRSVDALEWRSVTSAPTIVVAVDGDIAETVGPLAEKLMEQNRVIGVTLKSKWDPVTISWLAADPIVLVAQGEAGRIACDTARLAPGAIRALVLADYAPKPGSADHSGLAVPVLVFHGRASSAETHVQAVKLHDEIAGSHLIEPDDCAELPAKNCATVLAESLAWFLYDLGKPFMEFDQFRDSDADPVDPRA